MIPFSRRITFLFLALLLSNTTLFAQQNRPDYKLLWKISGKGLTRPSYLFGTMHLKDNRVFEFSDSVLARLEECQAFAMELHPDSVNNSLFSKFATRQDSIKSFREKLSKEEYKELNTRLQKEAGVSLDELQNKSPALIRMLVKRSLKTREDKTTFLDAYLYYLARTQRKQIIGIEHLNEQVPDIDDNSPEKQLDEIRSSLRRNNDNAALESLVNLYHSGDIEKLYSLFRPYYFANEKEDLHMRKRNLTMASRIDSFIRNTPTFVAVGAAHLPGDQGLIRLLQDRGFAVTPVKATFSGKSERYKPVAANDPWATHLPEAGAYTISMPGKPYLLRVGEMKEVDSYIYSDLGTGLMYYSMTVNMPAKATGSEQDKLFTRLMENMVKKREGKLLSEQKITFGTYQGRELNWYVARENNYYRCRTYIRGNSLYMLLAAGSKISMQLPDIARYFDSFKMVDYKTMQWKNFTSDKGGFTVWVPSTLKEETSYADNAAFGKIPIRSFMSTDEASGKVYLVSYLQFPANAQLLDDSTFLYSTAQNTVKEIQASLKGQEKVQLQGFPGLYFRAIANDNSFIYQSKIFIRGTRPYVITALSGAEGLQHPEAESFFNSFTFTDFPKTEWKPFSPAGGAFSVLTPSVPKEESDTNQFNPIHLNLHYVMQDANTGIPYTVSVFRYSDYFHADSPDAFFRKKMEKELDEADSVLSEKATTVNGYPARELVLGNAGTHRIKRVLWVLKGRELYEVFASVPQSMASGSDVNAFFASFKPGSSKTEADLFTSKTDLLLKHLAAADSVQRQSALMALRWYEFKPADRNKLYRALEQDYPDDTVMYQSVRRRLFWQLPTLQDTSAVAFIRQLYNKLPSCSRLGDAALGTLTRINTKESLRTFTGLMVSNPPFKQDNTLAWEMFYPLVDSTDNVPVMYPQVLQLLKNEKYKSSIYWLTAKALHKKVIGLAEYSPLKPQLYADVQALLSTRKSSPKPEYDEDEFLLTQMIELLGTFSQEAEAVRLLQALADDRNPAVAMEASLVLLKKNIAVPAKNLEKIAAQPITRATLYQILKELNKEKLFPVRYKKQAFFAESELVSVLTEEEESAPEKIELVKKKEVTYRGNKGIVYLFKYSKHNEEGKRTWYTGMSGLYENKDALFSDSSLTWPGYEEFNPKEIDKHIQKFLTEEAEE